jgi:DNA-binding GntR family transcriptional regulator
MSDGTKADDIALALEEAIVSGEIPPGSVLRQEHLSEQFQVSRTPVREALRRLAALGLVTFEPNRGVRVRMLSRDEIGEAFLVRAELESLATEIATPKMTEEDLGWLEAAEARFSELTHRLVETSHAGRQDLDLAREWLHANHAFHDVIYAAADVPLIERMAKAARRTFLVRPVWATGADLDDLFEKNDRQHRAIREAIAARSPEGARVLAREHVLSSGRLLEAILFDELRGELPAVTLDPGDEDTLDLEAVVEQDDIRGKTRCKAANVTRPQHPCGNDRSGADRLLE